MRILILSVFVISLFSCADNKTPELEKEIVTLKTKAAKKDSLLKAFVNTFNQVGKNMETIRQTKDSINNVLKGGKLTTGKKTLIMSQIKQINSLMSENLGIIDTLQNKFDLKDLDIGDLNSMVSSLSEQVNFRDKEINELKYELASNDEAFNSLDYHLDLLSEVNNEQAETIQKQEQRLNTAWYIFDKYKALKEKGIITKEKGYIKLVKVKKLQSNINNSLFNQIDIRKKRQFSFKGYKPKLLTPHTKGSYSLKEEDGIIYLDIKDIGAFWSASRYLVIVLN